MDQQHQDWNDLEAGVRVTVEESGWYSYKATVDTKTADSGVVWVIPESGTRRAFDSREGVRLRMDPAPHN